MIKQENMFADVIGGIKSNFLGVKYYWKNRSQEVEYLKKNKSG